MTAANIDEHVQVDRPGDINDAVNAQKHRREIREAKAKVAMLKMQMTMKDESYAELVEKEVETQKNIVKSASNTTRSPQLNVDLLNKFDKRKGKITAMIENCAHEEELDSGMRCGKENLKFKQGVAFQTGRDRLGGDPITSVTSEGRVQMTKTELQKLQQSTDANRMQVNTTKSS